MQPKSLDQPIINLSRRYGLIVAFSIPFFISVAALWVFIKADLERQQASMLREASVRLESAADLGASQLALRLLMADAVLTELIEAPPNSPPSLAAVMARGVQRVQALESQMPVVVGLLNWNERGVLIPSRTGNLKLAEDTVRMIQEQAPLARRRLVVLPLPADSDSALAEQVMLVRAQDSTERPVQRVAVMLVPQRFLGGVIAPSAELAPISQVALTGGQGQVLWSQSPATRLGDITTVERHLSQYAVKLSLGQSFSPQAEQHRALVTRYYLFGISISLLLIASLYWFFAFRYASEQAGLKQSLDLDRLRESERELSASRQLLRELATHQINLKEEERKRIALEIHDELGQRLTAMRLEVAMMEKYGRLGNALPPTAFGGLKDQIDQILKIVRNVASRLRPATLDIGLSSAIMGHLEDFREKTDLAVEFVNQLPDNFYLSEGQTTGIFRILQESLTNIARHSQASEVRVSLVKDEQFITMTITDNGKGFDTNGNSSRSSMGISGMKERAVSLGGQCLIQSSPQQGTQMIVRVPLDQPELIGFASSTRNDPLSPLRSE